MIDAGVGALIPTTAQLTANNSGFFCKPLQLLIDKDNKGSSQCGVSGAYQPIQIKGVSYTFFYLNRDKKNYAICGSERQMIPSQTKRRPHRHPPNMGRRGRYQVWAAIVQTGTCQNIVLVYDNSQDHVSLGHTGRHRRL